MEETEKKRRVEENVEGMKGPRPQIFNFFISRITPTGGGKFANLDRSLAVRIIAMLREWAG